ncbi:MAG: hypothetical protein PHQ27_09985 [Victivallales bacterium]|nr:hypothetical protein [Victivallales bacterium]
MIPIDIATGFFIYLLLWMLTIAILWGRKLWRDHAQEWMLSKNRLFRCDSCHYAFINKENTTITRCPRCNNICIFRKHRRF